MDKTMNISDRNSALVSSRISLSRSIRRKYLLFILLIAPAFLLRLVTAAYPILQTIYLGFTNLAILKGTNAFVGLDNYLAMGTNIGVRGATTVLSLSKTIEFELFAPL